MFWLSPHQIYHRVPIITRVFRVEATHTLGVVDEPECNPTCGINSHERMLVDGLKRVGLISVAKFMLLLRRSYVDSAALFCGIEGGNAGVRS